MAEEPQQITKEPQQITKEPQQIMKEPQGEAAQVQRVTTKNPKKVEAGKRLAESNHKKREAKKREERMKLEASGVNQYYGIGAVLALGVIGGLGYYIYRTKKVEQPQQINHTRNHRPTSLRWIKSFLYYKMDKKSIVNDLYQAAVISVLEVGYSMLGKKILKVTPPSVQTFDLEDTGKLVAIVAASEMTREYLIKQKILPYHINIYKWQV